MKTFKYHHEDPVPLSKADLFKLFNDNRVYKFIIELLVSLGKTDLPQCKVLEPGCGNGSKLRFFSEFRVPPENCYGLEISEKAIEICQKWSPAAMNFDVGSVMDMHYEDNFFDLIICSGLFDCFNEDKDIGKVSKELSRVLKNDGIVFILDINENFNNYYRNNPAVMAKNLRPFNSQTGELEALLENEFTVVSRVPSFVVENYFNSDGEYASVYDLPSIDAKIDKEEIKCAYTLWTFFKKL
ncbi:class I SAM-dependent methyltransferase [Thalassotalea castellviae]|uniref:Class I SAM-dependent methyltransferase n=1 Tax=Thalassotalea castellviae TaxID=3075612 RepID=A0ABU3A309_9GAMM|nr:class I SAM-dependent methyltransferase [Thalassotalea sp. W431]MDT0604551.1 class I SAM-dependent methyltransferase [Thalassotalea sp. W431]